MTYLGEKSQNMLWKRRKITRERSQITNREVEIRGSVARSIMIFASRRATFARSLAREISASLQVVRVAAYQNVQNCCTFRAAVRSILRPAMDITSRTFGAIVHQPSALSAPAPPPCSHIKII